MSPAPRIEWKDCQSFRCWKIDRTSYATLAFFLPNHSRVAHPSSSPGIKKGTGPLHHFIVMFLLMFLPCSPLPVNVGRENLSGNLCLCSVSLQDPLMHPFQSSSRSLLCYLSLATTWDRFTRSVSVTSWVITVEITMVGITCSVLFKMTLELKNVTSASRHIRVIPPTTSYFSMGLGDFFLEFWLADSSF